MADMLSWYNASWPNSGDGPALDPAMQNYVSPLTDANNDASKKHAACDECRKRKLKCSGEHSGCTRCIKQNIICHYSTQKQMGRPRKRQKSDDEATHPTALDDPALSLFSDSGGFPPLTNVPDAAAFLDMSSLCPKPYQSYIRNITSPPRTSFLTQGPIYEHPTHDDPMDGSSSNTPPSDSPPTPENGQVAGAPYASWPDYSSVPLPSIVHSTGSETTSLSDMPSAATPACSCLANLYLTLSHLSTLPQFPLSPQTIISLETAMRTAKGVLYCVQCPKQIATAIQNVMLLATCLSVIADGWGSIFKRSPQEVWRALDPSSDRDSWVPPMEFEWRRKTRAIVRRGIYGDVPFPTPSNGTGSLETKPLCLMDLVEGMENRQKTWHNLKSPAETGHLAHPGIGIMPPGGHAHHLMGRKGSTGTNGQTTVESKEEEMFCLKVVENVRNIISMLELDGRMD